MEPLPATNTTGLVQDGLDAGVQTLFSAAAMPLARADELRAVVTGPAVKAVLEMRIEQMVKHGHTLEGDLDLPLGWLGNDARIRIETAIAAINADPPDYARARERLVSATALGLAAIDVLDATINGERG